MKKLIIVLFIGFLIYSCKSQPEDFYTISGELTNGAGEKIYFVELQTSELKVLDSLTLPNEGIFSFKGKSEIPKFYLLKTRPNNYITLVINPHDKIVIKGDAQNFGTNYTVEGSEESSQIKELREQLDKNVAQLDEIGQKFKSGIGTPGFVKLKDSLSSVSKEVFANHKEYTKRFIEKNKSSLSGLMALYQQVGPRQYVLDPREDMKYFVMVDSALYLTIPNSDAVKALHAQVNELKRQLKSESEINTRFAIGAQAPEIALPGLSGDTIVLSSFKGKYILLDFWASWCRPCRVENPVLVKNYKKYHDKGFEIFQVSLDKTKSAWEKAILSDSLNWIHVSDLKYWDSAAARLYNIQGIPANFLLDKNGKIIAKNLRGDALEAKLSELFD